MDNYYTDSVLEELQKIARETDVDTPPVAPESIQDQVHLLVFEVPQTVGDFLRERREYRERTALVSIGVY